jgi:hypothetical protein
MKTNYTLSESKHFFVKETTSQSIITDTYSTICLLFMFWFNYNFIGGSYIVNFLILVVIILKVVGSFKKIHKFKTKDELMEFLKNNDPQE